MSAREDEVIVIEEKINPTCDCSRIPAGESLKDSAGKKWKLGGFLNRGGCGSIFLASRDIPGSLEKYVVKLAKADNVTLYREIQFYRSAARIDMIVDYCSKQNLKELGIPHYIGSGIHWYENVRYRFLILPRYYHSISSIHFAKNGMLSMDLANSIVVQMLYALEYIHGQGYVHNDIKGENIILRENCSELAETQAMLIDFGLVYQYRTSQGLHKPFLADRSRAHAGTLHFISRDAHQGAFSRRGDLESLGYSLIQWHGGRLPWDYSKCTFESPLIAAEKRSHLDNLEAFLRRCFQKEQPPKNVKIFMEYVVNLRFESRPDYTYLRTLFREAVNMDNIVGNRMSYANPNYVLIETNTKSYNLRSRNASITTANKQFKKETQKDSDNFDWPKILASHPDKVGKIRGRPPSSPVAAAHLPRTPKFRVDV